MRKLIRIPLGFLTDLQTATLRLGVLREITRKYTSDPRWMYFDSGWFVSHWYIERRKRARFWKTYLIIVFKKEKI